jgi:hypothetical protein
MKRGSLAVLALAATACSNSFTPDTLVNSFRVLGVEADQPELHPGDTTALHALVVDPTRPGQTNTLLWIGCDPDPLDLGRSACSDLATLQDPTALALNVDGGAFVLPPGMHEIGFDDSAAYQAPTDTFADIPDASVQRLEGSVADVLIIAAAGELPITATDAQITAFFTSVQNGTIPSIVVIDRVVISEEQILNQNPVLDDLWVDGAPIPDGGTFRVSAGETAKLSMTAPASSYEQYDLYEPDGTIEPQQEELLAAFYSTTGTFSDDQAALDGGIPVTFTAPDGGAQNPLPTDRGGTVWVVVRDTRGGESWVQYPLFICDSTLPAPAVTGISPTSGVANGSTVLTLQGENLSSVLDVALGDGALRATSYFAANQTFRGLVPPLPSGSYPVTVRGRDCHDYPTGLSFTVP